MAYLSVTTGIERSAWWYICHNGHREVSMVAYLSQPAYRGQHGGIYIYHNGHIEVSMVAYLSQRRMWKPFRNTRCHLQNTKLKKQ